MSPLNWLAFWLTLAIVIDVGIIGALFVIAIRDKREAYRAGWVDGTMGSEYGHSYPGELPYPARHNGQPIADPEDEWLPRTPPWDEPQPVNEETLIGTIVIPQTVPPLPPHLASMAHAVTEEWETAELGSPTDQFDRTLLMLRLGFAQARDQIGRLELGAGHETGGSGTA